MLFLVSLGLPPQQEGEAGCLKDANSINNMCGELAMATCTGRYGVGPCCSSGGYCGSTEAHCGRDGMGVQPEYSHSKGICASQQGDTISPCRLSKMDQYWLNTKEPLCLTIQEVANAWWRAVATVNKVDSVSMCVPAVVIAASAAYDSTEACPKSFDLSLKGLSEGAKPVELQGLWQIGAGYDPQPEKQALAVYHNYTSSQSCLSDLCVRDTLEGCSDLIPGIKQDQATTTRHRFCRGVWPRQAAEVSLKLQLLGGLEAVQKACNAAATGRGCDTAYAHAHGALAKVKNLAASKAAEKERQRDGNCVPEAGVDCAGGSTGTGASADRDALAGSGGSAGAAASGGGAVAEQGLLPAQEPH